jgi:hypothetical protein
VDFSAASAARIADLCGELELELELDMMAFLWRPRAAGFGELARSAECRVPEAGRGVVCWFFGWT